MLKKKINAGLVLGILVYSAFISVLYFRMRYAEKVLAEYNDRLCPSSFDCRLIEEATILDYGSNKVSFINYGSKGLPLERGTFEKYVFSISTKNIGSRQVFVLPNIPSDTSNFDISSIYIPSKADKIFLDGNLFNEKKVSVEIWRGNVTLILVSANTEAAVLSNQDQTAEGSFIGPATKANYELVLPTKDHPVILAEDAENDFNGWTTGVFVMVVSAIIFGGGIVALMQGIDWLIRRVRKHD